MLPNYGPLSMLGGGMHMPPTMYPYHPAQMPIFASPGGSGNGNGAGGPGMGMYPYHPAQQPILSSPGGSGNGNGQGGPIWGGVMPYHPGPITAFPGGSPGGPGMGLGNLSGLLGGPRPMPVWGANPPIQRIAGAF